MLSLIQNLIIQYISGSCLQYIVSKSVDMYNGCGCWLSKYLINRQFLFLLKPLVCEICLPFQIIVISF